jgi:antirestriction protein
MTTAATLTTEPRIYVACLAAYNNGNLHGAWIDATQGEWSI